MPTDPLLIDVPTELTTERLVLRPPRAGDGDAVHAAVDESLAELQPWMPWSVPAQTAEQSESFARRGQAKFLAREELTYLAFLKGTGTFAVGTGLHRIDWAVPRFEIGYWCRTSMVGQGLVSEAVGALAEMAFARLGALRVEIRMDDRNERSWRVAERAGFELEGIVRNDCRDHNGHVRDTRVYARVRRAPQPRSNASHG